MQVKCYVLPTQKATFVSFSQKLPLKGVKSSLAKEKIKKSWIEKGNQPLNLPIIFIRPETLSSISKKINRKPTEITINFSELFSFNALKEKLLKEFTS